MVFQHSTAAEKPPSDSDIETAGSLPRPLSAPLPPIIPTDLTDPAGDPPGLNQDTSPEPPPNGGLQAWLQVLGAFFLAFNTWGISNAFGVFQAEYSSDKNGRDFFGPDGVSQSAISWVGSVQGFLTLIVGVVCGRLLDAGHFYADLVGGICLQVFGMMMTSLAGRYYQVFLAQGVACGVGAGMVFLPGLQVVGTYFSTRRSTAVALGSTGSAVGGIVYPVLFRSCISRLGSLRWAIRVVALVMLATLVIPLAVMRPRRVSPGKKSGPGRRRTALVDARALRDPAFATYLAASAALFLGLYVPFFYVEKYAVDVAGIPPDRAAYAVLVVNAASLLGRLLTAAADRVGNLNVVIPAVLAAAVATLAWIGAADTQPGLVVVAVLFGIGSGAIQAITPGTVAFLCPDLSRLGTNIGMSMGAAGVGLLVGTPVAGAIIGAQSGGTGTGTGTGTYWGAFTFSGVAVLVGGALMVAVRVIKVGWGIVKA